MDSNTEANENPGYNNAETTGRIENPKEIYKPNLTVLKWAHAVNSQKQLTDALNSDVDFIEADVVLGKLNDIEEDIPIMAHPPATTSDLSLNSFLLQIKNHNESLKEKMKGVKLDFKSIEVLEGALPELKDKISETSYPVWLNADIVKGPVNESVTTPVNPERFFKICTQFRMCVLSIGWTTEWFTDFNNGSYSRLDITSMLTAINNSNVIETGQPITFPVRAGIAANSLNELQDLVNAVEKTNACTLTIWSSPNDYINIDKLRNLISSFGSDRVYLDVPEDVCERLDLNRINLLNKGC